MCHATRRDNVVTTSGDEGGVRANRRRLQRRRSEVGVDLRRANVAMTEDLLHILERLTHAPPT
jgi:hypothetical protein